MGFVEGGDDGFWMAGDDEGSLSLLLPLGLFAVAFPGVVISVGVLGGSTSSVADSVIKADADGRVLVTVEACDMLTSPSAVSPSSTAVEVITTGVVSKATVGALKSPLPL